MSKNIVLVDDDDKIAELSGQSLELKGYNVKVFFVPEEAMEFILSNSDFDILITDNIMPGMNGIDLIKECQLQRPELKCILATGEDSTSFEDQQFTGQVQYVAKPFKRQHLIDKIEGFE